jgi:predicted aspartyl protease
VPPDEVLRRSGPCVDVIVTLDKAMAEALLQSGQTVPPPVAGKALIDTGASSSCIDESIARGMRLPAIDVVKIASATHTAQPRSVYPVQIEISGVGRAIAAPRAIGVELQSLGFVAIVGRDVLRNCTLFYNGIAGQITLSSN